MPAGRPPKLSQVIDHREDGTPVTAAEKVIELTRTVWSPMRYRAAHAGLTVPTINFWRREGGLARAAMARGEKVTANQKRYAEFLTSLEKAEAEAVADRLAGIYSIAQGGHTTTKVTTKTAADGSVETTETVETTAPNWTALAWILERRRPAEFGRRVEVTGAGGEPLIPKDDRADSIGAALEGFLAGADTQRERQSEAENV